MGYSRAVQDFCREWRCPQFCANPVPFLYQMVVQMWEITKGYVERQFGKNDEKQKVFEEL